MRYLARIYVTPRADVLDPQGKAIGHALHSLGFDETVGVRLGRYLEMDLQGDDPESLKPRISEMCEKLLSNPVVEDYRYELTEIDEGT